jgi:hypothetical protein
MTVDGEPHEVIGVLPQSFRFLGEDADVLLPLQPNRAISFVGPLGENGIARLRSNVTIEDANVDIERMMPILTATFPPVPGMDMRAAQNLRLHPNLRTLKEAIVGDLRNVLSVLMGTIAMLLLMACANVANYNWCERRAAATNSPCRRRSAPRAPGSRSNCSAKTRWWLSWAAPSGWGWRAWRCRFSSGWWPANCPGRSRSRSDGP